MACQKKKKETNNLKKLKKQVCFVTHQNYDDRGYELLLAVVHYDDTVSIGLISSDKSEIFAC